MTPETSEQESLRLQRDERNERAKRLVAMRLRNDGSQAFADDLAALEQQVAFDAEQTSREDAAEQAERDAKAEAERQAQQQASDEAQAKE